MRSFTGVTFATVAVCRSLSRGSVAVRSWWDSAVLVALADRVGGAVPLSEALRMKKVLGWERKMREVDISITLETRRTRFLTASKGNKCESGYDGLGVGCKGFVCIADL